MNKTTLILAFFVAWPFAAIAEDDIRHIDDALTDAEFEVQLADSRLRRDIAFPVALDPDHPIHAEAEKIWKDIERREHPLLNDPNAPFLVYRMAALALGIPMHQPR